MLLTAVSKEVGVETVKDPYNNLEVRRTDNGMKDCDLEAPQVAKLLELDERGLPVGWEAPNGNC